MSYDTLVADATARPNGPTKKQIDWVLKLASERRDDRIGLHGEERIENVAARIENGATKQDVSRWISALLKMPVDEREVQIPTPRQSDGAQQPKTVDATLTPGVYDVDGHVYIVKANREKTRLYAKRLVEIAGERLTESDELVKIDFVYDPGAIFNVKPEQKMDFERAKALTIRYGRCINCGRHLTAGKSVERGIGPVCRKSFL